MPEFVNCMTFSELKKMVAAIEKDPNVTDETKVMLDTGWDSLQDQSPLKPRKHSKSRMN